MRRGLLLALLLVCLLAGCSGTGPQTTPDNASDLRRHVDATGTVGYDGDPHFPPTFNLQVIKDQDAWAKKWREYVSDDVPFVPFDQRVAVLMTLKGTPTGGWTIDVGNVTLDGGVYRIDVVTHQPARDCSVAQIVAETYAFVTFDRKLSDTQDDQVLANRVHTEKSCVTPSPTPSPTK